MRAGHEHRAINLSLRLRLRTLKIVFSRRKFRPKFLLLLLERALAEMVPDGGYNRTCSAP
jgi:hypothetical protein